MKKERNEKKTEKKRIEKRKFKSSDWRQTMSSWAPTLPGGQVGSQRFMSQLSDQDTLQTLFSPLDSTQPLTPQPLRNPQVSYRAIHSYSGQIMLVGSWIYQIFCFLHTEFVVFGFWYISFSWVPSPHLQWGGNVHYLLGPPLVNMRSFCTFCHFGNGRLNQKSARWPSVLYALVGLPQVTSSLSGASFFLYKMNTT